MSTQTGQPNRWRWPLTFGVVVAILGGSVWLARSQPVATSEPVALLVATTPTASIIIATPTDSATATAAEIVVYVSGAVQKPGVYHLPAGARVDDAITAAGGLTDDADAVRINLAARLHDEQQIYVPRIGEGTPPVPLVSESPPSSSSSSGTASNGLININRATLAELDTLPGVGPTIAQRIIDYRTTNGPFATIEDIQNVRGIGPSTFADMQSRITVGD